MVKYVWLPGEVVKDRLTRREEVVYSAIKYMCFFFLGLMLFLVFILEWIRPNLWIILIALLINIPALIFALALKTDTRVVHGISWLRGRNQ